MAKTKDELVKELLALDPTFPVKDDHNKADIEKFIALVNATAENAALKEEVKTQKEVIEGLNEALKEADSAKESKNPTVTVGKAVFEVVHGVNIPFGEFTGKYTKEEISKNRNVAALLVEQNSSAVKELKN